MRNIEQYNRLSYIFGLKNLIFGRTVINKLRFELSSPTFNERTLS